MLHELCDSYLMTGVSPQRSRRLSWLSFPRKRESIFLFTTETQRPLRRATKARRSAVGWAPPTAKATKDAKTKELSHAETPRRRGSLGVIPAEAGIHRATRYETRATVKARKTGLDIPSPYGHNLLRCGRLPAATREIKGDARGPVGVEDGEKICLTPALLRRGNHAIIVFEP